MKRFFECTVPITKCNVKCSYCYIIQEGRRNGKIDGFLYSADHIANALTKERLGGTCYFSLCGNGETLIPKEIIPIAHKLLENGHFVNITTNGTLTNKFEEIINNFSKDYLERLHFSFSFHFTELKKKDLVGVFLKNVALVKASGCSFLVQINLTDEYIECWDEIKHICLDNFGALPHVALTRDESFKEFKIMSDLSFPEYVRKGKEMNSPLFDFTVDNFNQKRTEFCYAGEWSAKLNIGTGDMMGCYGMGKRQNIYKSLNEPIKFEAIGCNCVLEYCVNSSHFMSLGVIPSKETPTYGSLRNRKIAGWQSEKMCQFLSEKLIESNQEYSPWKKGVVNIKYGALHNARRMKRLFNKVIQ
ncbi:radical SAM protein [Persicobacter psychrovividus]|uniref:Radical SAM core domain-containing protein n=1 Tax=Persicobacter psychrovividus TaxID=387638 RepID=A0ABM7VGB5_9BACT|nr:hypothetical protein PEPS_22930 [Persicobacter psychrovividus]